jgi:hypothetical protein
MNGPGARPSGESNATDSIVLYAHTLSPLDPGLSVWQRRAHLVTHAPWFCLFVRLGRRTAGTWAPLTAQGCRRI